jgi:hypothetical protein
MANGVDALVKSMQPAFLGSTPDPTRRQSSGFELPAGHHPVLSRCDLGYRQIDAVAFCSHTVKKATASDSLPPTVV